MDTNVDSLVYVYKKIRLTLPIKTFVFIRDNLLELFYNLW